MNKGNKEILQIVKIISNEKNMDEEIIFSAIETALAAITAKRYGEEVDIRVAIDRKTGVYETFRRWTVIADNEIPEFPGKQTTITKAKEIDPSLDIGDIVEESVESEEFGRIGAQKAKQIIMSEIRQAERNEILKHYQELIGTMISGIVKKIIHGNVLIDIGNNLEAMVPQEELIPRESVRIGDRLRGILYEVRSDRKNQTLLVSRTRPQMLIELFKIEVPEIGEEIIEIKSAARDPGSRAKIAVKTNDGRIDPIGACIGIRGSRVQAVSNELGGERIDVVLWDADPAQLAVNAMAPAEISSIVVDENSKSMDIIVREDQLAQAIGRNGQNVRLASELAGWKLNVTTAKQAEEKTKSESKNYVEMFTQNLDVDEDLANLLVDEGFHSLEDVAYAPLDDLAGIEGFDNEIAEALRTRARDVLLEQALSSSKTIGANEPAKDLLEMEGMTRHLAYLLASRGIITREDLADACTDDLSDIEELSEEDAGKLIMTARKPWFK